MLLKNRLRNSGKIAQIVSGHIIGSMHVLTPNLWDPRSGVTPKWDFGVAMLPVGALCFHQAHFGRTVLPKWPFWAHLFYSVLYNVLELRRACFRQERVALAVLPPGALFRARAFALPPVPPNPHAPAPTFGGFWQIWPGEGATAQWKWSPPSPGSLKPLLFPTLLNKVQKEGTQGVRARYDAELAPVIQSYWSLNVKDQTPKKTRILRFPEFGKDYHSFRNHYMFNSKTIKSCNCNCWKLLECLRGLFPVTALCKKNRKL